MHNFLVNLLSSQSVTVCFRIWINLVQFRRSSAFCHSMKHAHISLFMSKVRFYIILSIPIASLFSFPLQNPNWSSPSTYSIFLLLSILATMCDGRSIFHLLAFSLRQSVFSLKFMGHSPDSYFLLISCVIILRPSFLDGLSTCRGISSSLASLFIIPLIAFSTSLRKIQGPFSSAITSSAGRS